MKSEFTKFDATTEWVSGKVGSLRFEAKLFDKDVNHGINGGRISRLIIFDDNIRKKSNNFYKSMVIHWDKCWDIKPTKLTHNAYESVVSLLEGSPKRFDQ